METTDITQELGKAENLYETRIKTEENRSIVYELEQRQLENVQHRKHKTPERSLKPLERDVGDSGLASEGTSMFFTSKQRSPRHRETRDKGDARRGGKRHGIRKLGTDAKLQGDLHFSKVEQRCEVLITCGFPGDVKARPGKGRICFVLFMTAKQYSRKIGCCVA